ncbi:hypothetical protein OESDEN_02491 [Oesophagostomum dentatum]|uniref:Uncharacterized protein n=1 Tax=Oesophagostomum dentatum TaxID=61180 RepID=A0A0B1TJV5_OESDE|nr:hypothetical protein OESDEN_02491 [Oesophagostomum dentatum]
MPPSKIPVATPISSASKSGCRPRALPPQPLRNANHLPASESETFQGVPRPNYLPPTSKDFVDVGYFSKFLK